MRTRTALKDRFQGKIAIVTGGSTGIGFCIAHELAKEGAKVCFTGRSDLGFETEKNLKDEGFDVLFLQGDMSDEAFCKKVVVVTAETFGGIDLLVNNAFSFLAKAEDAVTEDWYRSFFTGPVGYARMIQNVKPYMIERGGGAIVNLSSISGHIAQANRWTYNVSKGAVDQLTKCSALDYAKYGIRINSISPGWIWTREVIKAAEMDGGGRDKYEKIWGEYHMLDRCAEPIEVAGPALFLLSDDASFITGTDLPVDGGYLSLGPEGLGKTAAVAGSL